MPARAVAAAAAARAGDLDHDGAFPCADVQELRAAGLLEVCLPTSLNGSGLGSSRLGSTELAGILRAIGHGSLPLGRLYEGHVNAWRLIARFGSASTQQRLAVDARRGCLFGVWNTGPADDDVRLQPASGGWQLSGIKVLASGAGFVDRPLITGRLPDGTSRMLVVTLDRLSERADLRRWRATGMRASASGAVDFTGCHVTEDDLLGGDGDYQREPDLSAGAWRFAAVHQGGVEALLEELRTHLRRTGRGGDPHQESRLGQAALACETARLWVMRAAEITAGIGLEPDTDEAAAMAAPAVAYVRLARTAVERAALDTIELVQRSIGLQAFMRPNPVERIARDLATYLRQPGPDRALVEAARYVLRTERPVAALWPR